MQPVQIEQFIEMYMPWMFEQRRRAQEQGLLPSVPASANSGVNNNGDFGKRAGDEKDSN